MIKGIKWGRWSMKQKFIYWQDGNMWVGYFEEFPDYWAQGEALKELKENLKDLWGI